MRPGKRGVSVRYDRSRRRAGTIAPWIVPVDYSRRRNGFLLRWRGLIVAAAWRTGGGARSGAFGRHAAWWQWFRRTRRTGDPAHDRDRFGLHREFSRRGSTARAAGATSPEQTKAAPGAAVRADPEGLDP